MIQAAPAPAHDLFGMGHDLCRRLAPSPAPCPPQGKRASLRLRRSVGSAPANAIDAVKRTASIAFGSCKHAVKAYTDVLRMELEESGAPVSVPLIKPSAIDTPYMEHARSYLEFEGTKNPPPSYDPQLVAKAMVYA